MNRDDEKDIMEKTESGTEYTHIPLKDTKMANVSEHLEEFKENLLRKAQSFSDDTDKMTDDLMKETEQIGSDVTHSMDESITTVKENIMEPDNNNKTPTHSIDIDSLKTNSPEPEIENAILNDTMVRSPSPVPTLSELKEMSKELTSTDYEKQ